MKLMDLSCLEFFFVCKIQIKGFKSRVGSFFFCTTVFNIGSAEEGNEVLDAGTSFINAIFTCH